MMLFELQVLTSLEPVDYMFVAFLPGISEVRKSKLLYSFIPLFHWYILVVLQELLFRGALLPIFGINWPSILGVATLFGVLHLGSGRKYSFAVWYYNLFFFALDETFLHLANYDQIMMTILLCFKANAHLMITRYLGPHLLGLPMVMLQCCPRVFSCLLLLMP